ncbi:hypothetical protein BH10ACT1_BH10ACT1_31090 [soil metagenome]
MKAATAVDRALLAPGSPRCLVVIRTAVAVVIGLRLAGRRWWAMADRPGALFEPAWAVSWLSSMPPGPVLVGLQAVGVAAALAAVAGWRPRAALAVAWLALVVLAGLWGSLGKVTHNEVLLILATAPLLAASTPGPGEERWSLRWGWPPRAALAVIAVVYAVSGAQKLGHSGWAWVTSDNLRWVLLSGARGTRSPFPGLAERVAQVPWATHAIAAGALATELSAPLLLAFRRTRPAFVVLAAALHTGIWLMLGLDYAGWVLTVAAVAVPLCLRWPEPLPRPHDGAGSEAVGPIGQAVGP